MRCVVHRKHRKDGTIPMVFLFGKMKAFQYNELVSEAYRRAGKGGYRQGHLAHAMIALLTSTALRSLTY